MVKGFVWVQILAFRFLAAERATQAKGSVLAADR